MSARWIVRSLGILLAVTVPVVLAQHAEHAGKKSEKKASAPAKKEGAAPAAGMPKPAPEMAQLKWFVGTWSCEGSAPESPMGPAHKTQSTVAIRLDMNGFWYSGTVREAKTAENPHPLSGMFHETYDTANKQFVLLWVDNFGGWATETTPGMDGDKINYSGEGVMGGQKMPVRDAFVKKSETELTHTAEMSMNGQWRSMGEETCKKAPAAAPAKK